MMPPWREELAVEVYLGIHQTCNIVHTVLLRFLATGGSVAPTRRFCHEKLDSPSVACKVLLMVIVYLC